MNVPSTDTLDAAEVLDRLTEELANLTPELRKAAAYLLENPAEISVASLREIAEAADVKPNTLVRMARSFGFEGFEAFRIPFREEVRQGRDTYPDRARWLQSLAKGGKLARLNADMAEAAMMNIEGLYSGSSTPALKAAADAIVSARACYVLGVGIANAYARNFAYLASMAIDNVTAIPADGSLPVDGLVQAREGDVLMAMTFKPYRREVVEAVKMSVDQGLTVISISDSLAAPIMAGAAHRFVMPTDTPQFFPSTVALSAFLETLIAFVVADADADAVNSIETFHARRAALGVYWDEGEQS